MNLCWNLCAWINILLYDFRKNEKLPHVFLQIMYEARKSWGSGYGGKSAKFVSDHAFVLLNRAEFEKRSHDHLARYSAPLSTPSFEALVTNVVGRAAFMTSRFIKTWADAVILLRREAVWARFYNKKWSSTLVLSKPKRFYRDGFGFFKITQLTVGSLISASDR